MRRRLLLILMSATALISVASAAPVRSKDTNTTTVNDSTKTPTEAYIGGGFGTQRLDGNEYLSSFFSRYTNDQIVEGSTRLYFVIGAITRYGVFEAQLSFFSNGFAPTQALDHSGELHFEESAVDAWYKWQFSPIPPFKHLVVAPGIGLGVSLPNVWYRVSDNRNEELLTGAGVVLAFGLAVEYRTFIASLGIEYQYRESVYMSVEKSDFVTFPGESNLDINGSVFYIVGKLYWEINTSKKQ